MSQEGCNQEISSVKPEPILYIIDHFKNPQAGTEGQLYQLINGLDRTRFSPELLVFGESEYLESGSFPCPYKVLGTTRISSPNTWFKLIRFARLFRRNGGRVAHIFFNDPSVICPPIFRIFGIRCIISRRDMGYWYTSFYILALQISSRIVSAAIVNSRAVKNITIEREPIPSSKVHIIYNGYADDPNINSSPIELEKLRSDGEKSVLLGIVANIRPIKRIEDVVLALASLTSKGYSVGLAVIGDGDPTLLERLAYEHGIHDRVCFLGRRNDVKACLAAIDIGVLCSESEGFSNTIIEYMQAGLPVVCSDVGGNPEAIHHGESGFLYSMGCVDELVTYLEMLITSPDLRREIGRKAYESASSRFSVGAMIEAHERIYLGIQKEGDRR